MTRAPRPKRGGRPRREQRRRSLQAPLRAALTKVPSSATTRPPAATIAYLLFRQQDAAGLVLVHRVITNFRAESEGVSSGQIVERLLEKVKP